MTILGIVFAGLGLLTAIGNIGGLVQAGIRGARGEREGYSSVHFVSLLSCGLAWLITRDRFMPWILLPIVLDPANWLLAAMPFLLISRKIKGEPLSGSASESVFRKANGGAPVLVRSRHPEDPLERARRLLIEELDRSAAAHEVSRYTELGTGLDEIEGILALLPDKRAETMEDKAYRLLDCWVDPSQHGWLHYEPVGEGDWPRLARRMRAILDGQQEFRAEEFRGVLD